MNSTAEETHFKCDAVSGMMQRNRSIERTGVAMQATRGQRFQYLSTTGAGDYDDAVISFVDVHDPGSPEFQRLWLLYNTSFHQDERRSLLEQELVLDDPRYHFAAIRHEGRSVGLLGYWLLHDMFFIEHFAIADEYRSEGIGGDVIEQLQYYADRKIVLDVEPRNDSKDAARRVRFYTKHGFRYCPKPVVLPSYWFAKPIASNLMIWSPNNANLTQRRIVSDIRHSVYSMQ